MGSKPDNDDRQGADVGTMHVGQGGIGVLVGGTSSGRPPLNTLPRLGPERVGRTHEFAAVEAAFDRGCPEVVLRGASGVGKTRVAVEYAEAHQSSFSAGVFFLRCETFPPMDLVSAAISLELPMHAGESFEDQCKRALHWLASRPALLIYDNVESVDAVTAWLPPSGSPCRAILTSTVDYWPRDRWEVVLVSPLPDEDARSLVKQLVRDTKAVEAYSEPIVRRAAGITMELCALAKDADRTHYRGRVYAIPADLADVTRSSFEHPWKGLPPDARLLLRVACLFEASRVPEAGLRSLLEGEGWESERFEGALDAARDRLLLAVTADALRVHTLVAAFVRSQVEPAMSEALLVRHVESFAGAASAFYERPSDTIRGAELFAYPLAVREWEALGPEFESRLGRVGMSVGGALYEAGRFDEARAWFERAVKEAEKGDQHGRVDPRAWALAFTR